MAKRRSGLPNIYITWIAKLLGGDACTWSAWFKAHYWYQKAESMGGDLAAWNLEHTALMDQREAELRREGFTDIQREMEFRLEWPGVATVNGKADIVALREDINLVRTKRPSLKGRTLEGEVQYKTGGVRIPVPFEDLTPDVKRDMLEMIRRVAADAPPARVPSRQECRFCNIGRADCPDRYTETPDEQVVEVSEADFL